MQADARGRRRPGEARPLLPLPAIGAFTLSVAVQLFTLPGISGTFSNTFSSSTNDPSLICIKDRPDRPFKR
ncbi:hypothetical protein NECAME_01971 [Necator americanus]|uniref:Uncharacterized protein n=1 Tax=Necator americanus TaxID=51031 RepID=W2TNI3_NECAM|nr:hypothetical protein NECAME_01971 [Necator americanus]ETN82686.1 hypothetical protein NECAME_01971 [Necator americanus]